MFSKKLTVQLLGASLYKYGISDIVISPGSRNAPLIIEFTSNQEYNCYSIVDERSAAFFALGMAQAKNKPVVLCCTSGTASANYYPAIIEAFYQNIPLLILTADRPEHFVDIFDGQTIRQKDIYKNHIYGFYSLSEKEDTANITDNFLKIKAAVKDCFLQAGPVHINIPFSEPLYEQTDKIEINIEKLSFPQKVYKTEQWKNLPEQWNLYSKKMILVGMQRPNKKLNRILEKLAQRKDTVILTEITSNLDSKDFFPNIDTYLSPFTEKSANKYQPELLLTIGQNLVSKKIKSFLRNASLQAHWHLDPYWHPDTYFSLTEKIKEEPVTFLESLTGISNCPSNYSTLWKQLKEKKEKKQHEFLKDLVFSDLKVIETLDKRIPDFYNLQISNSSMIRYTQLFHFNKKNSIFCNRGASGIDGATSTATGFATAAENPTILITGDIGFFYDSNALWNPYIPASFRIILVNNGGGDIFNIIPGPDTTEALNKFFVTKHKRTAYFLAKEYNFDYTIASNLEELQSSLDSFFEDSKKPKLLEINTQHCNNGKILREYFHFLDI